MREGPTAGGSGVGARRGGRGTGSSIVIKTGDPQRKALVSSRRADRILLVLLGAVWPWKAVEITGKESHLLRRNLGWGYLVDLTIPSAFTGALELSSFSDASLASAVPTIPS